jgi:hypothetical protein
MATHVASARRHHPQAKSTVFPPESSIVNITTVAVLFLGLSALIFVIKSLLHRRPSLSTRLAATGLALFLALLASLGALHAWGESQSIGWTIGYGGFAIISLASAARQFLPE